MQKPKAILDLIVPEAVTCGTFQMPLCVSRLVISLRNSR